MKITVAKNSGFCFGVKRAYDLACVNSKNCEEIYILGKLVHNNDVCRDLKKRGIKEIGSISDASNSTLIFTAHGIGPKAYQEAQAQGMKIIDTTCPKVMKAHRLAKICAGKKHKIILFGDKKHKEVKSILEWAKGKAKIISSSVEAKKLKLTKGRTYCLIAQTTQNVEEFKKIIEYLKSKVPSFQYFRTICDSTDNRQKETRKLAENNDAVIVIGGRDSANSGRLFEIARELNPRSYFIENEKQLKSNWLKGIKTVAVSAGASTPEWVIKKVVSRIKKFK